MRTYLSLHPTQDRSYSPEELDMLDAPAVRVVDILGITDDGGRNEAAAHIGLFIRAYLQQLDMVSGICAGPFPTDDRMLPGRMESVP